MKPSLASLLYLASHITADERAEHEAMSFSPFDPQELAMRLFRKQGASHLFLDDKEMPYYVAGFETTSPHVATAWSVSTPACQAHLIEMTRISRKAIKALLGADVHRIQMSCLASRQAARRWYEALGAEHEATFQRVGRNGEDFVMYAILREGL